MSTRAAIGLGSNQGERRASLQRAIEAIAETTDLVATSQLYETAPIGGPEQDDYLNAVVLIDTALSPRQLLDALLKIEVSLGRQRTERWGPRTIDLDILLYGEVSIDEPGLTIPHPELPNRRFVIEPLLEVWPDAALPDGTAIEEFRAQVGHQEVRPAGGTQQQRSGFAVFVTVAVGALAIWWLVDRFVL